MKAAHGVQTLAPAAVVRDAALPVTSALSNASLRRSAHPDRCLLVAHRNRLAARASSAPPSIPASPREAAASKLKAAATDKGVPPQELANALITLESTKVEYPGDGELLRTLGGTASPGYVWRLVFTSNGKLKREEVSGSYFPILGMQRFDASAMEIENGVFLGPLGYLTFRGPFSFARRRLPFLFRTLELKLGPFPPIQFNISSQQDENRVPGEGKEGRKDPFFVWFYADDEIIAARGRSGGVAFWTKYEGPYKA